jgi:hypothetical protein
MPVLGTVTGACAEDTSGPYADTNLPLSQAELDGYYADPETAPCWLTVQVCSNGTFEDIIYTNFDLHYWVHETNTLDCAEETCVYESTVQVGVYTQSVYVNSCFENRVVAETGTCTYVNSPRAWYESEPAGWSCWDEWHLGSHPSIPAVIGYLTHDVYKREVTHTITNDWLGATGSEVVTNIVSRVYTNSLIPVLDYHSGSTNAYTVSEYKTTDYFICQEWWADPHDYLWSGTMTGGSVNAQLTANGYAIIKWDGTNGIPDTR